MENAVQSASVRDGWREAEYLRRNGGYVERGIGVRRSSPVWPRILPLAGSLAAALASTSAFAQTAPPIQQRIDGVFENLPQNPAELAIPLSRRALAKRASVLPYLPEEPPPVLEGFGRVDKSAAEQTAEQPAVPIDAEDNAVEEGSADAGDDGAARIPPPRPDQNATPNGPVDLVAAPAAPETEAPEPDLVAAAAITSEEAGSPEPASAPSKPDTAMEPAEEQDEPEAPARAAEEETRPEPITEVARAPLKEAEPFPEPDPATVAALGSARDPDAPWVPPPRPNRPGDKEAAEPGAAREATVAAVAARPSGPCLTPDKVADRDDDFSRNAAALSADGFCITQEKFKERKRPWTVQTVTSGKPGPLWAVLHDDENESFDTAVHALQTYGGVLVTVETGGKRNQDGIDPNRNFSDVEISCPKLGKSASPKFTGLFKKLIDPSQPIVALHNNFEGPVPTKGLGHVSMMTVPKDMRKVASKDPESPLAGEHALVLLAAAEPVDESAKTRMQALAGRGLNVVLEPVREGNGDCSLSNYAVLSGHEDYFNVTVHHDEGEKQRKMIEAIMGGFPTVSASR